MSEQTLMAQVWKYNAWLTLLEVPDGPIESLRQLVKIKQAEHPERAYRIVRRTHTVLVDYPGCWEGVHGVITI